MDSQQLFGKNANSQITQPGFRFQWWWAVLALLALLLLSIFSGYNGLVTSREDVRAQRGNLQSQYQRRSDLIPNLVTIVKQAGVTEEKILTDVIDARAKATSININADNVTPEQLQQFQAAQNQLSTGLGRLLAVQEAYPQLKSISQFQDLSAEVTGTENRIGTARRDFNQTARNYNGRVQTFPNNLTAGLFGFSKEAYFEADAGTQAAPKVQF